MAETTMRLFFGIKPDLPLQQAMDRLRQTLPCPDPGRPVAVDNIHITLAFLGDTPPARLPELCQQAERLAGPAFELSLTTLGWFRRSQVLWLAPDALPEPMCQLATALRGLAGELGLHREHKPFRPHITLYRKVRHPPPWPETVPPLIWHCRQFNLFASVNVPGGVRYESLGHWPLNSLP